MIPRLLVEVLGDVHHKGIDRGQRETKPRGGRTRHRHGRHLWTDLDAFLNSRSQQQLTSQHGQFSIYIFRLELHHVSVYSTPNSVPIQSW